MDLRRMSYEFYKILHITSLIATFMSLAAMTFARSLGSDLPKSVRIFLSATHGIGLALVLISGFGLAARLGMIRGLPNWIYLKIGIWLLLGASIVLAKRKSDWAFGLYVVWLVLGSLAASLAVGKWA